mgnify:CR=1 FL=1
MTKNIDDLEEEIIDDDELIELIEEDFDSIKKTYDEMTKSDKTTTPFLTKYERAKIIGVRAQQIADGAVAMIKVPKEVSSPIKIAELELQARKIPLIVRRYFSGGEYYEDWSIEEFLGV